MNSYKNHPVYEFVLYNLYTICTVQIVLYKFVLYNLYDKKMKRISSDSNPCANNNLTQQLPASSTAHQTASNFIIYDYIDILHKKTIWKMRLYKFIRVPHRSPSPLQTECSRFCEVKFLKKETHNKNEENTLNKLNKIFLMVYGLPK
jgi:hypothetical protein